MATVHRNIEPSFLLIYNEPEQPIYCLGLAVTYSSRRFWEVVTTIAFPYALPDESTRRFGDSAQNNPWAQTVHTNEARGHVFAVQRSFVSKREITMSCISGGYREALDNICEHDWRSLRLLSVAGM